MLKDDLAGSSEYALSSINKCLDMRWDVMCRCGSMCAEQRCTRLGGCSMTADEMVAAAKAE